MKKPMFSRSAESCLLGKRTEAVHSKIPCETADILRERAREVGMTVSEFVAWKLMIEAHGFEHVNTLQQRRLAAIAGKGSE